MDIQSLSQRFSSTREDQIKAVFASLFILQNRLQTAFDNGKNGLTLKQFMLLVMVRQTGGTLTLTKLGELLGCSRQNIKKLALSLEQKGVISIVPQPGNARASILRENPAAGEYFAAMARYHGELLGLLFCDYSPEELTQLFTTLTKLYTGVERLEHRVQMELQEEPPVREEGKEERV